MNLKLGTSDLELQTSNSKKLSNIQITTQELGKRFNREWIFRNLTFNFTSGNTYAITGPNGSGKSTLLHVLWGQVPASTGTVRYTQGDTEISVEQIYQHISIATPYMDLIDEFTLLEQLQFHFKLKKSRDDMSLENMLDRMNLEHAKDKYISNFSSGMRQRLKLALAFFTEADIAFLDEPGTNLDSQAFAWYVKELNALPNTTLTFIASNQPAEYPENSIVLNVADYKK
ncbi:MAG: ATP-binding cassette domain-containing protein [Chryseolinea sp.]